MERRPRDLEGVEERVRERGLSLGLPFHFLEETRSTNDDAKDGSKAGAPHGSTWVADSQTEGRGRQGRRWMAPPGEALLFSTLLRIHAPVPSLPPLALVAGLAVHGAVVRAGVSRARLKWPNDVVVERDDGTWQKIAGVLVEAQIQGRRAGGVVIGIGINVHTRAFPEELAPIATSVALSRPGDLHAPLDRGLLLVDVLAEIDRTAEVVAHRGLGLVHAQLSAADVLRGRRVKHESGEGTAAGIDTDGSLLVRRDDGTRTRWSAGEVHLVPLPRPLPLRR